MGFYGKGNSLKLIIGCMFSSKTSSLLNEINRFRSITNSIMIINSKLDNRYSLGNNIINHNKEKYPAVKLKSLEEMINNKIYKDSKIILIDEGHFYKDLHSVLSKELSKRHQIPKHYIVAGLSSDYKMESIGDITKMVPLANEILHLNAMCAICKDGTPAHFTKLKKNFNVIKKEDNIIVGNDQFIPCCRHHYHHSE